VQGGTSAAWGGYILDDAPLSRVGRRTGAHHPGQDPSASGWLASEGAMRSPASAGPARCHFPSTTHRTARAAPEGTESGTSATQPWSANPGLRTPSGSAKSRMLQQTQVATVIPLLGALPRSASPRGGPGPPRRCRDVLAGCGGWATTQRARNLHRAAQEVVARFGWKLPSTADALLTLPGFGRYTAGRRGLHRLWRAHAPWWTATWRASSPALRGGGPPENGGEAPAVGAAPRALVRASGPETSTRPSWSTAPHVAGGEPPVPAVPPCARTASPSARPRGRAASGPRCAPAQAPARWRWPCGPTRAGCCSRPRGRRDSRWPVGAARREVEATR
jgi:hypothetical protein